MDSIVLNFQDFISFDGTRMTTDSLKVAAVHRKRHDDILRLIRKRIAESGEWGLRNFTEGVHFDPRNHQFHPMFTMTREGYQFLVGKMTGKKAVQHQIAFIEAFAAMEAFLKNQREGLSYRCAKHELECKDSARRGSFHGRGLNLRKQEIADLAVEEAVLRDLSQLKLPMQ